ncbi:MAG TPA: 6,7-dimethyl-8-ribityllumazine synthase [Acidimicrobiales bacterium]|nr:6,7-dimethyl-8-ribityllumazine synthase [Acidimicrobiales bacterium]
MTGTEETQPRPDVFDSVAPRVGRQIGRGLLEDADGRGLRIGLACALFNGSITSRLLDGALEGLAAAAVDRADTTVAWVPGAFELPLAAQRLATAGGVDAVACLGAVIRGDTAHFDFVAGSCASGLARVALDTGVPVVFGVLTTDNVDQALERARPDETNKGREAALSAVQMAAMLRELGRPGGARVVRSMGA